MASMTHPDTQAGQAGSPILTTATAELIEQIKAQLHLEFQQQQPWSNCPMPPKPDIFSTHRDTAEGWIFQLQLYFEATGKHPHQQALFTKTLLRDKVATWWCNYAKLI